MNIKPPHFSLEISASPCIKSTCLPLLPVQDISGHHTSRDSLLFSNSAEIAVGLKLLDEATGAEIFQICGFFQQSMPCAAFLKTIRCPLLLSLTDIPRKTIYRLLPEKNGFACAAITLSDKGAVGQREDKSGPLIMEMLAKVIPCSIRQSFLLPDDAPSLRALLANLALNERYDLIVTTGGTGIAPRDITPETTLSLIDKRLPGMEQAMMAASLAITPNAVLSRAAAGLIGRCIVVNLPGSVRAASENLAAILPALEHALKKANGDPADCGG